MQTTRTTSAVAYTSSASYTNTGDLPERRFSASNALHDATDEPGEPNPEFDNFEALTRRLLAVRKDEITEDDSAEREGDKRSPA